MKNNNWFESNGAKPTTSEQQNSGNQSSDSPVFYGRNYNEEVPFNQNNFNAFQTILDQRNELLGSVKSFNKI